VHQKNTPSLALLTFCDVQRVVLQLQLALHEQESCAIVKMTVRCMLYKWINWAVAEILPFEIFQDCGRPPSWITRNTAIRFADPEHPTLEPNMKCIESPVVEKWPFAYHGAYGTPILGGRGGHRISDGTIQKSGGDFIGSPLWPLRYL